MATPFEYGRFHPTALCISRARAHLSLRQYQSSEIFPFPSRQVSLAHSGSFVFRLSLLLASASISCSSCCRLSTNPHLSLVRTLLLLAEWY